MLITPWFAVATGFVVAAGLWIYSPHAELRFPNGSGEEAPCKNAADCRIAPSPNPGTPAANSTLPIVAAPLKAAGKTAARRPRRVTLRVFWQDQGKFAMLVTLSGRHVPRAWRLAFVLPGDQIIAVEGAVWEPAGTYKGTVTWSPEDASSQTPGSGVSPWTKPGVSFVLVAAGAPITPTSCSFNGAACKFAFAVGQTTPSGT
jgi:hypothetical protein